jgi:crotonobetainyl-CoA hydratase/dehydration protein DpgD
VALGAGWELVLACDLVVAVDSAEFGMPEATLSFIASPGVVHRLPRQLPMKIAMYHLLTGARLTATDAYRWGLVNSLVPAGESLGASTERLVQSVLKSAPLTVRAIKQGVQTGLESSLEVALTRRYDLMDRAGNSADAAEGRRAFEERREPRWVGR